MPRAKTGAGQAVFEAWTAIRDTTLLRVPVLREIAKQQGELIRLQNINCMARGLDRNGRPMAPYAKRTVAQRKRQGYQTDVVDLKRTGKFWRSVGVRDVKAAVIKSNGEAQIQFSIAVTEKFAGRLQAFRTGRFGKHGTAPPRDPIGLADADTAYGKSQRKELRRIALEIYKKELKGANLRVVIRDMGDT